jgi:hypothetical protein
MRQKPHKSKSRTLKTRKKMLAGLVVLVLISLLGLELTNTTHIFHDKKGKPAVISGAGTLDKGINSSSADPVSAQPQSQPTNSNKSLGSTPPAASTPASTAPPKTPYGNFVSNHYPGSGGSSLDEQSACNTTPGATCSITFTKAGTTKSLQPKTADSDGSVIWNWKPHDTGITAGSWKITAVATLNGQTASADDQISLEIQ